MDLEDRAGPGRTGSDPRRDVVEEVAELPSSAVLDDLGSREGAEKVQQGPGSRVVRARTSLRAWLSQTGQRDPRKPGPRSRCASLPAPP
jgi:hypothetical protein